MRKMYSSLLNSMTLSGLHAQLTFLEEALEISKFDEIKYYRRIYGSRICQSFIHSACKTVNRVSSMICRQILQRTTTCALCESFALAQPQAVLPVLKHPFNHGALVIIIYGFFRILNGDGPKTLVGPTNLYGVRLH